MHSILSRLQLFDNRLGVAGNRKLLVGCDNSNRNGGIVGRDKGGISGGRIDFLIQLYAGKAEVVDDSLTQSGLILAQTCGEYDTVTAAHRNPILADILGNLIIEHLMYKVSAVVTGLLGGGNIAVIRADA